jgi:enoyl-[acyl-carrier protein] reductase I
VLQPTAQPLAQRSSLLAGKKGLIMGVANDHSIAWGIARTLNRHGAELAFTYQGEAFEKRVRPLAESVGAEIVRACDVAEDAAIAAVFDELGERWSELNFVVHAIAYSAKEELSGPYSQTSRDNFTRTLDVSCYSFTAAAQRAKPLMRNGGSLVTLSYLGGQRVMPNYNVMGVAKAALEASVRYLAADLGGAGIRVNAISAGPMRTLAGAAIADAREVMKWSREHAPLERDVTLDDVGNAALYLLSDLSGSVTGEILHIDCGYHVMGMPGK